MIAGNIPPHPDFPEAMILMKAPPSMENCVDLQYRIVQVNGRNAIVAEFIAEPGEIERLAAGQPLRFLMTLLQDAEGRPVVPPIALWAKHEGEI